MANDLVPPGGGDVGTPAEWDGVIRAIGAVMNPLTEQQADVQKHAINADVEKHRIATQAQENELKRRFIAGILLTVFVAGATIALIVAGQHQLARDLVVFVAGSLTGAGGVKALQRRQ